MTSWCRHPPGAVFLVVACIAAAAFVASVRAFDSSKFQKCGDQQWCTRHRERFGRVRASGATDATVHALADVGGAVTAVPSSWRFGRHLLLDLLSSDTSMMRDEQQLVANISSYDNGITRVRITRSRPTQSGSSVGFEPFYPEQDVILARAHSRSPQKEQLSPQHVRVRNEHTVVGIDAASPHFKVTVRLLGGSSSVPDADNTPSSLSVQLNPLGLFSVGSNRWRMQPAEGEAADPESQSPRSRDWSVDVRFTGVEGLYGIPEHAVDMQLRPTRSHAPSVADQEPYRLFNADVFEYDINNPVGLYGSIPFLFGASAEGAVGAFVNNPAQMFVDIMEHEDMDRVWDSQFISEAGPIDIFLFAAPSVKQLLQQYAYLTGTAPLPQKFALGYHQCRWNYKDEADVRMVNDKYNEYDIPMDVVWLDIEHTHEKRYFTWDKLLFPDPAALQRELASSGRKMVTISDPHIKRSDDYHVHREATDRGYYVKNAQGGVYEGHCWPGSSSWLDFFNPEVREWYGGLFAFDRYEHSTPSLYTWIDMNEPSVFTGPEISMPKDAQHYGGLAHVDVHNMYGFYHAMATYRGLLRRSGGNDRPFILTRSFFAGSQRYAAVWTGDNTANWEHLAASMPMLLTLGLSGYPFVGADVGGFFGNPDSELFLRWNEAAAWQPFYRGHAHLESKRREPWVFGDDVAYRMREIVALRYSFLPYWYSCFYEHTMTGSPVMRPLFVEFPEDVRTYGLQDQFMVGSAIMVKPVVAPKAQETSMYLPAGSHWFDLRDGRAYLAALETPFSSMAGGAARRQQQHGRVVTLPSPIGNMPVLQRAGTVVPRQMRLRRSTVAMAADPLTLSVAVDNERGSLASGFVYIDDGQSFNYLPSRGSRYLLRVFEYRDGVLSCRAGRRPEGAVPVGLFEPAAWASAAGEHLGTATGSLQGDRAAASAGDAERDLWRSVWVERVELAGLPHGSVRQARLFSSDEPSPLAPPSTLSTGVEIMREIGVFWDASRGRYVLENVRASIHSVWRIELS